MTTSAPPPPSSALPPPPSSAHLLPHKKSVPIADHTQYKWQQQNGQIKYCEIINYERAGLRGEHHCVMCGLIKGTQCEIPNQNKDVCKVCDCSYWRILDGNMIVKFCKGSLFPFISLPHFYTLPLSLSLSLSLSVCLSVSLCLSLCLSVSLSVSVSVSPSHCGSASLRMQEVFFVIGVRRQARGFEVCQVS
jgi:hypothetical protein